MNINSILELGGDVIDKSNLSIHSLNFNPDDSARKILFGSDTKDKQPEPSNCNLRVMYDIDDNFDDDGLISFVSESVANNIVCPTISIDPNNEEILN